MALDSKPGPGFRPELNNGQPPRPSTANGYPPGAGAPLTPPGQMSSVEENPEDKFLANEIKTMKNVRPVSDLHIDELLHFLVENNATDLHIAAGIPPAGCLRIAARFSWFSPFRGPLRTYAGGDPVR